MKSVNVSIVNPSLGLGWFLIVSNFTTAVKGGGKKKDAKCCDYAAPVKPAYKTAMLFKFTVKHAKIRIHQLRRCFCLELSSVTRDPATQYLWLFTSIWKWKKKKNLTNLVWKSRGVKDKRNNSVEAKATSNLNLESVFYPIIYSKVLIAQCRKNVITI